MTIIYNNQNDKTYQRMLNKLLKEIFFDFAFWYDLDLWDERYESTAIAEGSEILSNICVYKTEILFYGKRIKALSVSAVATKAEYRGRGYARCLMEHIDEKYPGVPMVLSANDSVVDFYPKFGFRRVYEKLPVCECKVNNPVAPVKLRFDDPKVRQYVQCRVNFSQKLDCLNTAPVNLFHLYQGYLCDQIYELPEIGTMIVARQNIDTLKLTGVFSLREILFQDLLSNLPFQGVSRIEFGFMPPWPDIDDLMLDDVTDPAFVKNVPCELGDFKFPELSVT